MYTKLFWKDAIERAIATAAQFLLVLGGADGAGFLNVNIKQAVVLAAFGGIAAILKAIVATNKAGTDTASLTVDSKEMK